MYYIILVVMSLNGLGFSRAANTSLYESSLSTVLTYLLSSIGKKKTQTFGPWGCMVDKCRLNSCVTSASVNTCHLPCETLVVTSCSGFRCVAVCGLKICNINGRSLFLYRRWDGNSGNVDSKGFDRERKKKQMHDWLSSMMFGHQPLSCVISEYRFYPSLSMWTKKDSSVILSHNQKYLVL